MKKYYAIFKLNGNSDSIGYSLVSRDNGDSLFFDNPEGAERYANDLLLDKGIYIVQKILLRN